MDIPSSILSRTMRCALLIPAMVIVLAVEAFATIVIPLDDLGLTESSVGIVLGRVEHIQSVSDLSRGRVFTLIRVSIQEAFKGEFPDGEITIRQIGGTVGDLHHWIYGSPEFLLGERVLLYLDEDHNRDLRVTHLFQGKYSIFTDPVTGEEFAHREVPPGVRGLTAPAARPLGAPQLHEARPLKEVIGRIRGILGGPGAGHGLGQKTFRSGAREVSGIIEVRESFTFMSPAARWFEPDNGAPVVVKINSSGEPLAPTQGFDQVRAAFQAWSSVSGSSFRFEDGGFTTAGGFNHDGVSAVSFRDPNGVIQNPSGCAGTLAQGGFFASGQTRTVNGTTFYKITEGDLVFNDGWDGCGFYESFSNFAEVATHELGHVLGLGHATDPTATMYYMAHFDGRGAALRTDDENGLRAIYPLSTPAAATPLSPSGTIATSTPTYTWSAVGAASEYSLKVNDSTGTKITQRYSAVEAGCGGGTGTCSVRPEITLAPGPGQWWIQTSNSAGDGPWSGALNFVVSIANPTATTLTPDKAAPQPPNTTITFTAGASGGTAPYEYRFWLFDGSSWSLVRDWSSLATWSWTPGSANASSRVAAHARCTGCAWAGASSGEAVLAFPISTPGAPPTQTTLTPNKAAPQPPNTTITFTAGASGGTAPYEYRFWLFDGSSWSLARDWGSAATWSWTPGAASPGAKVAAHARCTGCPWGGAAGGEAVLLYPIAP